MTDTESPQPPLAALRGTVVCRCAANALTLSGAAADSPDDRLILTFVGASIVDFPQSLTGASIRAVDGRRYRITSEARDLTIEARALHVHRDIGNAFYRAVPPRPVPLKKRFFWRVVLALAGTRAGKHLLLTLRRQA